MKAEVRETPADRRPPEVLGLEPIRPIGRGGFGEVWLARNRTTGQVRAVKFIPLSSSAGRDAAGREIVSLTCFESNVRREHPHLLRIHHVGESEGYLFYLMDAADDVGGGPASADLGYRPATLQARLAGGPLPAADCAALTGQLLEGLACLHDAGVVHRDVKPANCLFVDGQLKLADFGLLAPVSDEISRAGTFTYMPPDGRMDARADVYAAGLVIYEMLTGLPAGSFPTLGRRAPEIARTPVLKALNRLVLRACATHPQERFATAREMLREWTVLERRALLRTGESTTVGNCRALW